MELYKLTINQPEIKEDGVNLITHHNKIIVRAKSEPAARKFACKTVRLFAKIHRRRRDRFEENASVVPWKSPDYSLCKVFKGTQYPQDGEAAILYPPDLIYSGDD